MVARRRVDTRRVYRVGHSGGGHAALLLAGRAPHPWVGVSVLGPISDVRLWWEMRRDDAYGEQVETACGGSPAEDPAAAAACLKRSPTTCQAAAAGVPLDIHVGLHDGRRGSVPFTHSLLAFDVLVAENDRLPPADVAAFDQTRNLPGSWRGPGMTRCMADRGPCSAANRAMSG